MSTGARFSNEESHYYRPFGRSYCRALPENRIRIRLFGARWKKDPPASAVPKTSGSWTVI